MTAIPKDDCERIRQYITHTLRFCKRSKPNLSMNERKAIRTLGENNTTILPTDKSS